MALRQRSRPRLWILMKFGGGGGCLGKCGGVSRVGVEDRPGGRPTSLGSISHCMSGIARGEARGASPHTVGHRHAMAVIRNEMMFRPCLMRYRMFQRQTYSSTWDPCNSWPLHVVGLRLFWHCRGRSRWLWFLLALSASLLQCSSPQSCHRSGLVAFC